jgi:hypothetical protein
MLAGSPGPIEACWSSVKTGSISRRSLDWRTPRALVISITLISLFLSLIETRVVWGYWLSRATLASELDQADGLVGLSIVRDGSPVRPEDAYAAAREAELFCRPWTNECREGTVLLAFENAGGHLEGMPTIQTSVWTRVWNAARHDGWQPPMSTTHSEWSNVVVGGAGIQFVRQGAAYVLLAYRTSALRNDRYAYVEKLYRLDDTPHLERDNHWWLEISGLEGVDWRVLWPLNAFVALLGWLPLRISKGGRVKRLARLILMIAVPGAGLLLITWAVMGVEWPWQLVVFLVAVMLSLPVALRTWARRMETS